MKRRNWWHILCTILLVLCMVLPAIYAHAEDVSFSDELIAEAAGDGFLDVPVALEAEEDEAPAEQWDSSEEIVLEDGLVGSFDAVDGLEAQAEEGFLEDGFVAEALEWEEGDKSPKSVDELVSSYGGDELVGNQLMYAVVLTIDLNKFMSGTPIQQVKDAAIAFCEKTLSEYDSDKVGIAIVGMESTDNTKRVLDFSSNMDVLRSEISKLTPVNGGCDISAGLALSTAMLSQVNASVKSIILMTQGIPNEGEQSTSGYYTCAEGDTKAYANYCVVMSDVIKSEYGCRIYTLGVGARLNENSYDFVKDFLGRVADYGSFFVKADEDMSAVMKEGVWQGIFWPFKFTRNVRRISQDSSVDQIEITVTMENHIPVTLTGPYATVEPGANGKIISGSATQSVSQLTYQQTATFRWTYEINKKAYPDGGKHVGYVKIGCTSSPIYYNSPFTITYEGSKTNNLTVKKTSVTVKSKGKKSTVKVSASANTSITYSSNVSAVKVSKAGKVTIPKNFLGKVTITVKAKEENGYKGASKQVKISVIPIEPTGLTVYKKQSDGKTLFMATWKKSAFKDGYQIELAEKESFSPLLTKRITAKASATSCEGSLKGTSYPRIRGRIRAYKTYNGKKYYSVWSYY